MNDGVLTVTFLDPSLSDAAFQLRGDYNGGSFDGRWGELTLAGFQERGAFTATAD